MEYARQDQQPVYGFGPGERPQRAVAEFSFVARAEEIDVQTLRRQKSLVFKFPSVDPTEPREFRIKRMGAEVKAGVT